MINLSNFNELVIKLQNTSSRIEKESLLSQYGTDSNKALFYWIFNPYIVTGISKKKSEKYKGKININKFSLFDLFEQDTTDYTDLTNMFNYFKDHNTGRDEDLIELEKFAQYNSPYQDLIYSIITKDLKLGIQSTTLNKVYGKDFIPTFDVMLAYKYFDDPDKFVPDNTEFILTTKLDGVRCVLINGDEPIFYSRQGQIFEGLVDLENEAKKLPKGFVYDGELLLNDNNLASKDLYRETMKVVGADKEKHNIIFNCFDILTIDSFKSGIFNCSSKLRKQKVHDILSSDIFNYFKEVKVLYDGVDKDYITYWLDKVTNAGGEGVMINIANAPYECKRTKSLLKVKKFNTADVRVIDLEEGNGQNAGKLGALKIEFIGPDGKIYNCDVGSGLTLEQREDFWAHKDKVLNKIIEISYFEVSMNSNNNSYSLRFPVFKHIRDDKTEISMY